MVSRIIYNSSYIDDNGFAVTQYDNVLNAFFYDATKDPWHTPTLNNFTGFGRDGYKYTNGVQDAGPVSASWRTEASSATRGSGAGATFVKPDFPEHALIVVTSSNTTGQAVSGSFSPTTWDIIDTDTNRHWMRFTLFSEAIASTTKMMAGGVGQSHGAYGFTSFGSTNGRASPIHMFNGSLFMGMGHGNGWGWVLCSFVKERAIYSQTSIRYDWSSNIANRNGGVGGWVLFDSVTLSALGQVVSVDMKKLVADGKEYLALATYATSWLLRNTFECQWSAIEGRNRYYGGSATQVDWHVQLTPSGKFYVWNASSVRVEVYYQVYEDANNSTNTLMSAFYDSSNPSTWARIAVSTDQADAMFVTDQTSVFEPSSSTIFLSWGGHLIHVISTYEINAQEANGKASVIGSNVIIPPVKYGSKDGGAGANQTFGRGSPTNVFPETTQFTWINHPMRNVGNTGASELEFLQNPGSFPGMYWEIDSGASTTIPLSGLVVNRKIHNNEAGNLTLHNTIGNEITVDGINRNTNPVIFLRIARGTTGGERWFTIAFCSSPFSGGLGTFAQGRFCGYMWVDGPGGGTTPAMSRLYRFDGGSSVDSATPVRIDGQTAVNQLPSSASSPDFNQFYIALTPTTIKVYEVTDQPIGPGASNNFTNDIPFLTATDSTYNGGQITFGPSFNSNDSSTYYLVNELSVEPPQPGYSFRGGSYKVIGLSGDPFVSRDVGRLVVTTTLESNNSPTIASEAHYQVIDMSVKYNSTGVDPVNGPQLFHVSSENNQVPDITSEWIYPGLPGPTG